MRQLYRRTLSEYPRNIVALGEIEHQTVELFEPKGRVFDCREMRFRATFAGDSERRACPYD